MPLKQPVYLHERSAGTGALPQRHGAAATAHEARDGDQDCAGAVRPAGDQNVPEADLSKITSMMPGWSPTRCFVVLAPFCLQTLLKSGTKVSTVGQVEMLFR